MTLRAPLMLLALSAAAVPSWAQSPVSAVPLFPGAVLNETVTREIVAREGDQSPYKPTTGVKRTGGEIKVYMTDAPAEDVVPFYIKQLGAMPGTGNHADLFQVKNGGRTPVTYDLEMHSFEDIIDEHAHEGSVNIYGKDVKKALVDNRKPYDGGGWVNAGHFAWAGRDATGTLTTYMLVVDDASFADDGTYTVTRTHIRVQWDTWSSGEN